MNVVFTGSRNWDQIEPVTVVLASLQDAYGDDLWVYVGDARGLDAVVREECSRLGIGFSVFVAQWGEFGKMAGPMRNRAMLDAAAPVAVLHAFPMGGSRGTWGCVREAKERGVPVVVHAFGGSPTG